MAVFKCKMCGGELNLIEGQTVCECEYCGSRQTVPSADNEKKMTLFSRANRLRLASEFDKAAGVYEALVADFPEESEAYWGLVLCRYGIEYVDDPATGKKIPTCHRSSFESIFDDDDFNQACENADAIARRVLRDEAKAIEEIRKGIIEVSGKEEPYDIFICYKETDEKGDRTLDSVLAQDIYDNLTDKGYRVFFSRITLEDKLGQEYEPYIFAALNSAKIMLAVGTDYEYYNAVWVKNEWSRFLKLMAENKEKHLIPCYKNIDAYDMPREFAKLQAQDMGKVGAMQDLLRGINKIIPLKEEKQEVKVIKEVVSNGNSVEQLLKRINIFLADGKWQEADEYCEKVLDMDAENAEAYLGKLMAKLYATKKELLKDCAVPFDTDENYGKIMQFGSEKLQKEIKGYVDYIKNRNETARLDGIYNNASGYISKQIYTIEDCETARKLFLSLKGYKNSAEMAERSEMMRKDIYYNSAVEKIKENTEKSLEIAISYLKEIPGWRDTAIKIANTKKCLEDMIAKRNNEEKRKKKRKNHIKLFTFIIVLAVVISFFAVTKIIIPGKNYDTALSYMEKGNNSEAIKAFRKSDGYKDSDDKIKECYSGLIKNSEVGDTVKFGAYKQDNNIKTGKEEIEWLVLDKNDGKYLLVSKYGLDNKKYNKENNSFTWETCSLRKWLNSNFINSAFTDTEKSMISTATVKAHRNPEYDLAPGNDTQDKVFVLSIIEAKKYFSSDDNRICKGTAYAEKMGLILDDNGSCSWWLRASGDYRYNDEGERHSGNVACVHSSGEIGYNGDFFSANYGCAVRPAMWIEP